MGPFDKIKLKDGIMNFLNFFISKDTQITENTDLDTDEDLKQGEEEVKKEVVNIFKKTDFTEIVINMYREGQKLYSVENYQNLIKLLSSVANKTTPWFQRVYSETQDVIKLMGTTSIQDLKLQQRRRPVQSKIKSLYDRHRR